MMTLASLTMILGTWTNVGVLSLVWCLLAIAIATFTLAYNWGKDNGRHETRKQIRTILQAKDVIEYTEKGGRWNYYWKDSGQPFNL